MRHVADAFAALGGPVAVRSSAIGEDGASASFAGQHATVLGVICAQTLVAAIKKVRESAHAPSAIAYRKRLGLDAAPRMGVVVQRLIDADKAGVLFTKNPMTGADERVIEASWGLGEAVVAGLVTPDCYRVTREGRVVERAAGDKDIAIRLRADGGTHEVEVDPHRAAALCLGRRRRDGASSAGAPLRGPRHAAHRPRVRVRGRRALSPAAAGDHADPLIRLPAASTELPATHAARDRGAGAVGRARSAELDDACGGNPDDRAELSVASEALTQGLVASYLLVGIVLQSPGGKLGDGIGHGRALGLGQIVFAVGAIVGFAARTMLLLELSRGLMAAGGAVMVPSAFALVRSRAPANAQARAFGAFGAVMGVAAAVGPLVGGEIVGRLGWPYLFVANAPPVLVAMLLARSSVKEPHRPMPRFDLLGSTLLGVGLVLAVLGLSSQRWALVGAGVVVLVLFFAWERRAANPVIDPSLFRTRAFAAGVSVVGLQNLAMYALLFELPSCCRARSVATRRRAAARCSR